MSITKINGVFYLQTKLALIKWETVEYLHYDADSGACFVVCSFAPERAMKIECTQEEFQAFMGDA